MTVIQGRPADPGALPTYQLLDSRVPITVDANGRLMISAVSAGVFAGSHTPSDAYANPTDAVNAYALVGGWNGTTWNRIWNRTVGPVDINEAANALVTSSQLFGYDTERDNVKALSVAYDVGSSAQVVLRVILTPPSGTDSGALSPIPTLLTHAVGDDPYSGTIFAGEGRLLALHATSRVNPPS